MHYRTAHSVWTSQNPVGNTLSFLGPFPDAIDKDLQRFDESERERIINVLTPLAYAGPGGLPKEHKLWEAMAKAIAGDRYGRSDIIAVLENERADPYITQEKGDDDRYRIYHEEFASYLRDRQPKDAPPRLISALLSTVLELSDSAARDWGKVLAAIGVGDDDQIDRAAYLFEYAFPRLRTLAEPGEVASHLELIARQFGITWQQDELPLRQPWRVHWAWWRRYSPHWILEEHEPRTPLGLWKLAVCELDGRPVVISGGEDRLIRVWDLEARRQRSDPLTGHEGTITSLAVVEREDQPLLVSSAEDGTLRIWDLTRGQPIGDPIHGHEEKVLSVATAKWDTKWIVASGGQDGTVRVRNPLTGDSSRKSSESS